VEDYNIATSTENENLAKGLLFIVDATSYSMQTNRTSYVASQIVERLNDIWQILSQGDPLVRTSVIDVWLPLLLDFIIFHIEMFDSSKTSSELRSRMLLTLTAVLLELQIQPNINPMLIEQVFDVSILLVDDLPDDARQNCARSLKDKTSDPRIRYIFGYSRPSMDWMQLSQKGKLMPYPLRRWEVLSEPTPNVGENDTSLSLTLFGGRKE
jgi:mediator of RNA polymerase II transcription subunit 12